MVEPTAHQCTHCGHCQNEVPTANDFGFHYMCMVCCKGELLPLCEECGVEYAKENGRCNTCNDEPVINLIPSYLDRVIGYDYL